MPTRHLEFADFRFETETTERLEAKSTNSLVTHTVYNRRYFRADPDDKWRPLEITLDGSGVEMIDLMALVGADMTLRVANLFTLPGNASRPGAPGRVMLTGGIVDGYPLGDWVIDNGLWMKDFGAADVATSAMHRWLKLQGTPGTKWHLGLYFVASQVVIPPPDMRPLESFAPALQIPRALLDGTVSTPERPPLDFTPLYEALKVGDGSWALQGLRLFCNNAFTNQFPATDGPWNGITGLPEENRWKRKIVNVAIVPHTSPYVATGAAQLDDYLTGGPNCAAKYAAEVARYHQRFPDTILMAQGAFNYVATDDANMLAWSRITSWPHERLESEGYDSAWVDDASSPISGGPTSARRLTAEVQACANFHAVRCGTHAKYIKQLTNGMVRGVWYDAVPTPQVFGSEPLDWDELGYLATRIKRAMEDQGGWFLGNLAINLTNGSPAGSPLATLEPGTPAGYTTTGVSGSLGTDELDVLIEGFHGIMIEGPLPRRWFSSPYTSEITPSHFHQFLTNARYLMDRGVILIGLPLGLNEAANSNNHKFHRLRTIVSAVQHDSTHYDIELSVPHYMGTHSKPWTRKSIAIDQLHPDLDGAKLRYITPQYVEILDDTTIRIDTSDFGGSLPASVTPTAPSDPNDPTTGSNLRITCANQEVMAGYSALMMRDMAPKMHHFLPNFSINTNVNNPTTTGVDWAYLWTYLGAPLTDAVVYEDTTGNKVVRVTRLFQNGKLCVSNSDMRVWIET